MRPFKKLFANAFLAIALALAAIGGLAAATGTRRPLPETWGTATTGFALNVSGVPVVTIGGTNYTAISTNLVYLSGTGVTNTLVVLNGLVYLRQ